MFYNTTHYTPFNTFAKEVDSIIKELSSDIVQSRSSSKLTFDKNENAYKVIVSVPGFQRNQLKVEFERGVLMINSTEKGSLDDNVNTRLNICSASRSNDIIQEEIKSDLSNGVLTVTFPVSSKASNKRITIM
jgi:HSP20 family molecular chaperone IbpA